MEVQDDRRGGARRVRRASLHRAAPIRSMRPDPQRRRGAAKSLVDHEDIQGFMPAMTMPYKVNDPALLEGRTRRFVHRNAGRGRNKRLSVDADDDRSRPIANPAAACPAITDADFLREGDPVPGDALIDQSGAPRPITSLHGPPRRADVYLYALPSSRLLPADEQALRGASGRDPQVCRTARRSPRLRHAGPGVRHASRARRTCQDARRRPRPVVVSTGARDEVGFAKRFGVLTEPGESAGVVVHNLRTAVIDAQGRLVNVHSGGTWTPADLVADLKKASASAH